MLTTSSSGGGLFDERPHDSNQSLGLSCFWPDLGPEPSSPCRSCSFPSNSPPELQSS